MNIGVFFGGKNTEHDVSIITGQLIIKGLQELGHSVTPVYISKDGKWYSSVKMSEIEFFKDKNRVLDGELELDLASSDKGLMILKTKSFLSKKTYSIELAFPALHGKNGEDGTIQGMFEMLNVAYVGCDVAASAISMDKILTKLFYQRFNIPTTKFVNFNSSSWYSEKNTILNNIEKSLSWPLFVKPSRLGSSIGMTKVTSMEDLEFAIEVALHYDTKVLVEEGVEDLMDITVAVLGNSNPRASLIQESKYSKDFFSYEDKYLQEGGAQLGNAEKSIIIPASLDAETTKEIQDLAVEVYKLMELSGTARIDFLYNTRYKKYYVNEVNTMPGTLYHHLWAKSGTDLKGLLTELIELSLERKKEREKLTTTFESTILSHTKSLKLKGN